MTLLGEFETFYPATTIALDLLNMNLLKMLLLIKQALSFVLIWYRFEQYVDYALDVPMYFAYRNNKYVDCTGMTFRVQI